MYTPLVFTPEESVVSEVKHVRQLMLKVTEASPTRSSSKCWDFSLEGRRMWEDMTEIY